VRDVTVPENAATGRDANGSPLPGWTRLPVRRLAARESGDDPPPEPGAAAIVLDCWQPRPRAVMYREGRRPPVIWLDGDILAYGWGRVRVSVPAGTHTLQAGDHESFSVVRLRVEPGQVVHLDFVQKLSMIGNRGRLVPPGTRPELHGGTTLWMITQMGLFCATGLWLAARELPAWLLRRFGAGHAAGQVDRWLGGHAGGLALVAVLVSAGWLVDLLVLRRRSPWHRMRPPRVRERAEVTRAALAAGARTEDGGIYLGDRGRRLDRRLRRRRRGRAGNRQAAEGIPAGPGLIWQARWSMTSGVWSPSHQPGLRELPRILDRDVRLRINGRSVESGWGVWWYPVPAGSIRVEVEHPVPAVAELGGPELGGPGLDASGGRLAEVYYWAHLLEDRLLATAVVPDLSAATLTTTRPRRGTVDQPVLPGRSSPGALLTDAQRAALPRRTRRGSRSGPGPGRGPAQ
jgi:hypothetical protein